MLEKILVSIAMIGLLIVSYLFLVAIPASIMATEKCLELGYPDARVTISLDSYCIGYSGAVNPQVIKLQ